MGTVLLITALPKEYVQLMSCTAVVRGKREHSEKSLC